MQKSEAYQENKNFISSSSLIRVCPRCGEHTRKSSAKTTDGVINIFFLHVLSLSGMSIPF